MYQAVIFDLDGTVLYTLQDLCNAVNYALIKHEMKEESLDSVREKVGKGKYVLMDRVLHLPRESELYQQIMKEYDDYYAEHCTVETKPYPGMEDLLIELKNKGIILGIITNKSDNHAHKIIEYYYSGLFDEIVGGDNGAKSKPDPTSLNQMIEKFHLDKRDVLYVGDSDVDVKTGRNANVDVCAVTWGFRSEESLKAEQPDYLIHTAKELEEIVLC